MMNVALGTGALPKMQQPASIMQAHFHSVLAGTEHPEEAWRWVRFLATPFYQEHFCKIGLWIPNQTAMLTEEGLKGWIREGIHPSNYSQFATDYLPKTRRRRGDSAGLYRSRQRLHSTPLSKGWPMASAREDIIA